jgi:hypothetical protein
MLWLLYGQSYSKELTISVSADTITFMSNNTTSKALIVNLENSDKRRLTNAVHDLFLVTEGYSPKVFTPAPNTDVEEGTLVDVKTLIMIIEDAAALITELRPSREFVHNEDQLQMKFDHSDY